MVITTDSIDIWMFRQKCEPDLIKPKHPIGYIVLPTTELEKITKGEAEKLELGCGFYPLNTNQVWLPIYFDKIDQARQTVKTLKQKGIQYKILSAFYYEVKEI